MRSARGAGRVAPAVATDGVLVLWDPRLPIRLIRLVQKPGVKLKRKGEQNHHLDAAEARSVRRGSSSLARALGAPGGPA